MPDPASEQVLRRLIRAEKAGDLSTIHLGPHSVVVLSWVLSWTASRGPMIEWAPDIIGPMQAQLARLLDGDPHGAHLRAARDPVALQVGPYTAVMLLGAIQWWLQQPSNAEHGPTFLDQVTDTLTNLFAGDPDVLATIHHLSGPPHPLKG